MGTRRLGAISIPKARRPNRPHTNASKLRTMDTTLTGIGEPKTIPTNALNTYIGNPRRGDIAAIRESLETNGQFRPIVVNAGTHTGTPNEVLVGNHTAQAIRLLADMDPTNTQWDTVTAYVVDVDADHAARIVLADNRTSDQATYNDAELYALLQAVDNDLDGTGYSYDDLDELEALFATQEETPTPNPDSDNDPRVTDDNDGRGQYVEGEGLVRPGGQSRTAGTYHEQPTRMMILSYDETEHEHIVAMFRTYHDQHPTTDKANANAIIELLEHYTGDTAPQPKEKDEQ